MTLEGCQHKRRLISRRGRDGRMHMTCATCYQRLVSAASDEDDSFTLSRAWLPDSPPPVCRHFHRQGIEPISPRQAHHDAVCTDCGVVLRHPDGPGQWAEVMFNGYLIAEPP